MVRLTHKCMSLSIPVLFDTLIILTFSSINPDACDMLSVLEELESHGARVVGAKMLVNYSIAKIVLQRFSEQGKKNFILKAHKTMQEYRNQFGNSFQSVTTDIEHRNKGIFRNASGVLAKNDDYYIKDAQ